MLSGVSLLGASRMLWLIERVLVAGVFYMMAHAIIPQTLALLK
jgi:hypothetical protein